MVPDPAHAQTKNSGINATNTLQATDGRDVAVTDSALLTGGDAAISAARHNRGQRRYLYGAPRQAAGRILRSPPPSSHVLQSMRSQLKRWPTIPCTTPWPHLRPQPFYNKGARWLQNKLLNSTFVSLPFNAAAPAIIFPRLRSRHRILYAIFIISLSCCDKPSRLFATSI